MSSSDQATHLAREDIQKSMISGFAWQGATKGIVQVTSWVSTIWVARILDPTDYGIMAIAGIFTGFAFRISELGLAEGLITRQQADVETQESVFTLGICLALVLYAILYFVAPTAAALYGIPEIESVIRIGGLGIFLGASKAVPYALVMRALDFRYRSLVSMAAQFAQIVVLVVLAYRGYGYWSLVWGFLVSQSVMALAYWRLYSRIPRLRKLTAEGVAAAWFGFKVTLNRLSYFLLQQSPPAIIGKVLGSGVLGFYNMAYQLAILPLDKIATIFNQVTFPAIARADPDRADDAKYLFLQTHKYLLLVAQPALIGIALVAPDLVPVILTEKWMPIVPALQVFCGINVLRLSSMIFAPVLLGRNKPQMVLAVTLVGLVILPPSVYVGAQFGLVGAVVAWAFIQPILFGVALRFLMKSIDMTAVEFFRTWIPASTSSVVMIVTVIFLGTQMSDSSVSARLAALIAAGGGSWILTLVIFHKPELRDLRRVIQSIMNKRKNRAES
jgi:O-antigen/teichoic acid export membrane protein